MYIQVEAKVYTSGS